MKTTILSVALLASLSTTEAEIGMGVLMIWPTARSTALAGAMTGLADEVDATYFNPAGLAFQTTARADINYDNWLQDLYPGMRYASAEVGVPLNLRFLQGRKAFMAGSAALLRIGRMLVLDEHTGRKVREVCPSRGDMGASVAVTLSDNVAIGLGAKLLMSKDAIPPWLYL